MLTISSIVNAFAHVYHESLSVLEIDDGKTPADQLAK